MNIQQNLKIVDALGINTPADCSFVDYRSLELQFAELKENNSAKFIP